MGELETVAQPASLRSEVLCPESERNHDCVARQKGTVAAISIIILKTKQQN